MAYRYKKDTESRREWRAVRMCVCGRVNIGEVNESDEGIRSRDRMKLGR